jgi:hypothetical protein
MTIDQREKCALAAARDYAECIAISSKSCTDTAFAHHPTRERARDTTDFVTSANS